MLIHCPRCQARATLPDSKEGAKVRCGECRRVFVALPRGARASGPNVGLIIGVGLAVVIALGGLWMMNQGGTEPVAAAGSAPDTASSSYHYTPPTAADAGPVDPLGWDGPAVQAAVALHAAAHSGDLGAVQRLLDPARIWAREQGESTDPALFSSLSSTERADVIDRASRELVEGDAKALVADWKPFDGKVVEMDDGLAVVDLSVSPADPEQGAEERIVRWKLVPVGPEQYRAWSWEQKLTRAEAARRSRAERGHQKVELSDGSVVFEKDPEPLGHLADTPPEVAEAIDRLYPRMIDLDLTTEARDARAAIVEIGRAAIPILLTGLFETKLDDPDDAIRANIIVQALRDITGQDFGYKPQALLGSAAGTSEERRQSAVRQWFAWWARNKDTFQEAAPTVDGTEELIELTDKERRWLERHRD